MTRGEAENVLAVVLRTLGSVFRAALAALIDTESIEGTTHDVITDTRKVFHPAATNEDDGVLLEVMSLTSDVGDDFVTVGQANLGHFT